MVIQAQRKTSSSDRHLLVQGDCGIPDGLEARQLLEVLPHRPHLGLVQLLAAAHLHLDSKVVHGLGHHLMLSFTNLKLQHHLLQIYYTCDASSVVATTIST